MMKRLCALLCAVCVFVPFTAFAEDDARIFFAPQSMNEENEIVVPVYTENLPNDNDGLCGVEFSFTYNIEEFSLKSDENGKPIIGTSSAMLVSNADLVDVSQTDDIVSVSYVNFIGEDSVMRDGPLFFLTFIPKSPDALWNSDNYYPLRFIPESVNLIIFDSKENALSGIAAEGVDTYIGGYNAFPTFELPKINKKIEFKIGSREILVNDTTITNDVAPYIGTETMLPVRFIAESIDADLYWDNDSQTVSMFVPYISLYLNMKTNDIYINAKNRDDLSKPEIVNDRTFIPLSAIKTMFGESLNIENNDDTVSLYFK